MSVKRIIVVIIAAVGLAAFIGFGINDAVKRNDKLQFQQIQLKSKSVEIQQLNSKYDKLNDELLKAQQDKSTSQEEIDKLQQQQEDLQKQKQDLENQLQAKLDEKNRIAAATTQVANAATGTAYAAAASGGCSQYFAAAGITSSIAMDIINRENRGCDPCVYNDGSATGGRDCNYDGGNAYGIPQALPGSKMASAGADWRTNPVTQLKWMQSYVYGRYGDWATAKAHHDAYGWY